jgi:hypothetical protein
MEHSANGNRGSYRHEPRKIKNLTTATTKPLSQASRVRLERKPITLSNIEIIKIFGFFCPFYLRCNHCSRYFHFVNRNGVKAQSKK